MGTKINTIINKLKLKGLDYSNFKILLTEIKANDVEISKDDILDLVEKDFRLQLHTTPNHLARIIATIAEQSTHHSAIDICCGTGNILYYLQNSVDDLTGIEINENIAALSNYFLPDIKLITADTFLYPFNRTYDLIVGNLPWGIPISYNDKVIKSEEAFIRKAFELCNKDGEIICIVPNNILFGQSFNNFRKEYGKNLRLVLGLPKGVMRNSNVKTAILHFTQKEGENTLVGDMSKEDIDNFPNYIKSLKPFPVKDLKDRWNPEYVLLKESDSSKGNQNLEIKPLKELADIIPGKYIKADDLLDVGEILYLKPLHIKNGIIDLSGSAKYIKKDHLSENMLRFLAQPGDIILSTIFQDLKIYKYRTDDPPAIISNNLSIIRSSNDDYISSYLLSRKGKENFNQQTIGIRKGHTIPHVSLSDLKELLIPILPTSELNLYGNASIEKATQEELKEHSKFLEDIIQNFKHTSTTESGVAKEPEAIYVSKEYFSIMEGMSFIVEQLKNMQHQIGLVHKKIDNITSLLQDLGDEFKRIKSLPRDEDEIIFKLCQNLDSKIDQMLEMKKAKIEDYIDQVKRWLDLWESLDSASQRFLPVAEFIYDKLSDLPEADFSPFVVQYCRSIENEIMKKLFESYHNDGIKHTNIDELIKDDLNNETTNKFAKKIKQNKQEYTLGEMHFIMSLLKDGGNTLKDSKLLQHFKDYIIKNYNQNILQKEYLDSLSDLISKYRNKAAHPSLMSVELARECQILLRSNLNSFLESKRM